MSSFITKAPSQMSQLEHSPDLTPKKNAVGSHHDVTIESRAYDTDFPRVAMNLESMMSNRD